MFDKNCLILGEIVCLFCMFSVCILEVGVVVRESYLGNFTIFLEEKGGKRGK